MNNHEYIAIVQDILENEQFQKLKNYYHHNSSIFEHVLSVSFLSYKICKKFNLDYISGARGALLHDFFLYDWRTYKKDSNNLNHGRNHPKVALKNASEAFHLNDKEKDIILKHMWPKSWGAPKYKESYVVTCVDKYCACLEYLSALRNLRFFVKLIKGQLRIYL